MKSITSYDVKKLLNISKPIVTKKRDLRITYVSCLSVTVTCNC